MKYSMLTFSILTLSLSSFFVSCDSIESAMDNFIENIEYSIKGSKSVVVINDAFDKKVEHIINENESIVIIKRNNYFSGSSVNVYIVIDGKRVATVSNDSYVSFIIQNGKHIIRAETYMTKSSEIEIELNSEIITFAAGIDHKIFKGIRLIKGDATKFNELQSIIIED